MKILRHRIEKVLMIAFAQFAVPSLAFAQITNPLGETGSTTVTEILTDLTRWLLGLVGVLALLTLVVGGIRLVVSFGRDDAVKSAKQIIFWAVVGLIVVFLSFAVILIVEGLLAGS